MRMAADGGSPNLTQSRASQVCAQCKARKKKCDKRLPVCEFCARKHLRCAYTTAASAPRESPLVPAVTTPAIISRDSRDHLSTVAGAHMLSPEPSATEASVYRHVLDLVRGTGRFVDDVSSCYFQRIHRFLPVISRSGFHQSLITLRAVPPPGLSALLLAISLITYNPAQPRHDDTGGGIEQLYFATESLLTQVQHLFPHSLQLTQARLLLAIHRYFQGHPFDAFQRIASCARLGYDARAHFDSRSVHGMLSSAHSNGALNIEEATNTWWGIVIYERVFSCDIAVSKQPLLTTLPDRQSPLPIEADELDQAYNPQEFRRSVSHSLGDVQSEGVSLPSLESANVGPFGRAAQAAWLIDQMLNIFQIPEPSTRNVQMQQMDTTLQGFLSKLLVQRDHGDYCEAIAIVIKALFTLHWHLVNSVPQPSDGTDDGGSSHKDQQLNRSNHMLDTATKLVFDIAEAHNGDGNPRPPSYSYLSRACIAYIHQKPGWEQDAWLRDAESQFRRSLETHRQPLTAQ